MKKRNVVAVIIVMLLLLVMGAASLKVTYHSPYAVLRAEADEDSTALDLTSKGNFGNKPAGAVELKANDSYEGLQNYVELIFCGGAAANKTFNYKVYAWRKYNGPAMLVCTGTGTLGTQAVVVYPQLGNATSKFWADTLTVADRWLTDVTSTDTTGNNEVAKLVFDTCGYEWLYVEISSADGATGNEAGDVSVYYSYF